MLNNCLCIQLEVGALFMFMFKMLRKIICLPFHRLNGQSLWNLMDVGHKKSLLKADIAIRIGF